jgi:hypothetical protein
MRHMVRRRCSSTDFGQADPASCREEDSSQEIGIDWEAQQAV